MLGASDRPLGASPAASLPPYWADSSPVVDGWGAFFKNVGSPPLAALALLVLLPLLALVALAVALTSRGPIIHRRRVLGQHGRQFDAFKFRTMVPDADAVLHADPELLKQFRQTHKLQHDPRVTPVGRLLRRTSLDELPQLVNVLCGDMWLVGPRMIAPEELERFGPFGQRRLAVKPGLTGLWQVSGRQTTSYERRVELDMEYIERWSLRLELSILLRTVSAVATGRGAC